MKTLANIFKVIVSNITTIIAGIVVGFLLPKIISVADYGFYKIFSLYFNYLGVLSLGIIDGIVLKYGAKEYKELDRELFRSYFAWYSILHMILTLIIAVVAICIDNADYKFVLLLLSINLFPANATGFLQQISQITQRFKEYSLRKILQSVANIALVVLLFVIYKSKITTVNYKLYLSGLFLINFALAIWYLITYKDIIFGRRARLSGTFKEVLSLAKLGFPLLLANMCSTLFMSLDRQFVSVLFGTEEYAVYAFAYSMMSLITVATSAISIVLYPIFKRADIERMKSNYKHISSLLLVFVFVVIAVYFPLGYFIEWFLPQYVSSIRIFGIVLPGVAISTSVTVVMHNYYKILNKSTAFFVKSVVALFVSAVLNLVAYLMFSSMEAISIASIFSLLVWYILAEWGLKKICKSSIKSLLYIIIMSAIFYLSVFIDAYWIGGIVYLLAFIVMCVCFFSRDYKEIKSIVNAKRN